CSSDLDRYERKLPELGKDEARSKLERLLKAVQGLTAEMEFPEDVDLLMKNLDERFRPPPSAIHITYRKPLASEERPTFLKPGRTAFPYSHTKLPPPNER